MADEEEIIPPHSINDADQTENVSTLLQSWGLPELEHKLKFHHIGARALFCLTEKDICELIPKIGHRAIFRSSLLEWRRQNRNRSQITRRMHLDRRRHDSQEEREENENIPIPQTIIKDERRYSDDQSVDASDTAIVENEPGLDEVETDDQHPERPQSEPLESRRYNVVLSHRRNKNCQVDVNDILSSSYEGQQIIAYYEVNGNFDYSHRRRLVTLLINEVIRKNRWLVQDDFAKISNEIVQLFPREEVSTYYTARNGTKNPKGCLYNKFLNLTRKLRQEGILQYRNNVQMNLHVIPERSSARHSGEIKCYRESS